MTRVPDLQSIAEHVAEAYNNDTTKPPLAYLCDAMAKHGLPTETAEALAHKTNQAVYLTLLRKGASAGRPLDTIDVSFPLVTAADLIGRLEPKEEDREPEVKAASPVAASESKPTAVTPYRTLANSLPTKIAAFRRVAQSYATALGAYEARGYDPRVLHKVAAIEAGLPESTLVDVVERAYEQHTGRSLPFKTADLQTRALFKQADSAWDMDVNPDALRVQGSWVLPTMAVGGGIVTGVAGLATLLAALNSAAEDIGSSLATN